MSFKMRCIYNIICTYLSKMSRRIHKKMVNSGCSEEVHQWLMSEMEGRLTLYYEPLFNALPRAFISIQK